MGKTIGIFGMSGEGKSTSTIINPDGTCVFSDPEYSYLEHPELYLGMNPKEHFIINTDMKDLPFPPVFWNDANKNYVETKDFAIIKQLIEYCAKAKHIKSVAIDTLNLYLAYKEYNDRKRLSFDQWRDIANDIIELTTLCNDTLRADQLAYVMGHIELITDVNGEEKKVLSVIGKKSKKQMPEGFFPICLFTNVEYDGYGNNIHSFETKANKSSAKTPIGMFNDFKIPNSLKLVDTTIRKYYKLI